MNKKKLKTIKIATILFSLYIIPATSIVSQNSINLDSIKGNISNMNNSFSSFQDSINSNFNDFQENQKKTFESFKKSIQKKWGQDNFAYSDSVNWIEYYNDNNTRSTVNFKEGKAYVELLVDPELAESNQQITADVGEAIKELVLTKGKVKDFGIEEDQQNNLSEESILENQLITEDGVKVTQQNIDQFTKEIIAKENVKRKTVIGTDGKSRTVVSISIPLAPDYLKVRANKVLPIVTKYANLYNIEPELILSVIHVESYFNPKAKSHANAIGLMQLVPSSGGFDSYKYVYGINEQPSIPFLCNPENNINLGTAYLKILMTEYFGSITNDESKRHCVVCSYNTGVGNVCLSVSGNKIVSNTVTQINKMTSDQTYRYLSRNLKYKEARDYIVKVNNKYLMYKKLLETD